MASYRSYNEGSCYRSKTGIGAGGSSSYGRSSAENNLPSGRSHFSDASTISNKTSAKERLSSIGNSTLKKNKPDEKAQSISKYSSAKDIERNRLHSGKSSSEDVRAKSPLSSSRSSLYEKYSYPTGKASERPSSVLAKYSHAVSRERSKEPDSVLRYGSRTYPGSGLGRSYVNDSRPEKKERSDHPPVSYRTLRSNVGRTSREPSPEISIGKSNSFRGYSKSSSYGRSGSSFINPSSSVARTSNDQLHSTLSYPRSDRFRSLTSTPVSTNLKDEKTGNGISKTRKETIHESHTSSPSDEYSTNSNFQDDAIGTLSPALTMITRGTSPNPPSSSSFIRSRKNDAGITVQKDLLLSQKRRDTKNQEIQCDRVDDATRFSRYGNNGRVAGSTWSTYLDKFSPNAGTTGTPAYMSRGYINNGAGNQSRINNLAYSRTNEGSMSCKSNSTPKLSPSSSQEIHGSANRSQGEQSNKGYTGLGYPRITPDLYVSKSNSSQECPRKKKSQQEVESEQAERDTWSVKRVNKDVIPHPKENSPKHFEHIERTQEFQETDSANDEARSSRENSVSNSACSNKRRSSISRLNRVTNKREMKPVKTYSNSPTKSDVERERSSSIPKSDNSSSSRTDGCFKISDPPSGNNSIESGSPQGRPTPPQSRSSSSKSLPHQSIRVEQTDDVAVKVPVGRLRSSSASSVTSPSAKIKGTSPPSFGKLCIGSNASSVNLRQVGPPDTRGKPPVPKNDPTSSATSRNIASYVNKDFRKSALNMENGDLSQSKYIRKKRNQRSMSDSSQDSQSEPNCEYARQRVSSSSSNAENTTGSKSRVPSEASISSSKVFETETVDNHSNSYKRRKDLQTASSNSSSASESSSSTSWSSEEDEEKQVDSGATRQSQQSPKSALCERGGKKSAGSSRTSIVTSSADEISLAGDKPPRPPSSPRSRSDRSGKAEEAKSFLMKALAPVTNLFKSKQSDSTERSISDWSQSNEQRYESAKQSEHDSPTSQSENAQSLSKNFSVTCSEKNDDRQQLDSKTKHTSSGEKPWWLDSNSDNVPEGVERLAVCNDDVSQDTTIASALPDDGTFKYKIWRQDSEEKAWWLDASEGGSSEEVKKQSPTTVSVEELGERSAWLEGHDNTQREEDRKSPNVVNRSHDSGEKSSWLDSNDNISVDDTKRLSYSGSPFSGRRSISSNSHSKDKLIRIRRQQSGEQAWWMSDDPKNVPEGIEVIAPAVIQNSKNTMAETDDSEMYPMSLNKISHIKSGERAWWMDSSSNIPDGIDQIPAKASISTTDSSSDNCDKTNVESKPDPELCMKRSLSIFPIEFPPPPSTEPLGDRASPEGIENPPDAHETYHVKRMPEKRSSRSRPHTLPLFIGKHTDIDDILGEEETLCSSPVLSAIRARQYDVKDSEDSSDCEEIDVTQVIIHDSTPKTSVLQRRNRENERLRPEGYIPLDDTALQLYKDGDYGAYLDLEASISEQQEEFDGFQTNRKNSIVLRTQLSVRVHTIIEKLLNSEGRELRRALFSLKQIFQEDKDLVHEFVQNDGLACLIKVGSEADQNYQNYILRALGQVMLYVDGMNGVMEHGQTVQWLYTLIASRFRLVVKTALKLLLVFVEYVETNSLLLVRAVRSVDTSRGMIPWTNVMKLLKDYDAADTELLIYATTLVNKCLNGIPDQDTYYDQVDCLEEQGIEGIIQRYMSKQGTDLDLLRQFQIYEAVLHHEDGNDWGSPIRQLDDNIRKTLRNRKSLVDSHERRKSRRHSTGTSPLSMSLNARLSPRLNHSLGINSLNNTLNSGLPDDDDESSSSQSSQGHLGDVQLNGSYKENKVDVGVTPALRRRRERAERQRSFIREQQEATANMKSSIAQIDDEETNGLRYTNGTSYERKADPSSNKISRTNSRKDLTPLMNAANKLDSEEKKPWYGKSLDEGVECDEGNHSDEDEDRRVVLQLKREGTVKDLTQKLAAQNLIAGSPVEEKVSRIGDMSGLISKAKEGLAKSKSKADVLKSPTGDSLPKLQEAKKSENELHWEELVKKLKRPLALCDLDFTDLNSDDEIDVLGPVNVTNGVPPPPPPMVPHSAGMRAPPPPPLGVKLPPPLPQGPPPPLFGVSLKSRSPLNNESTSPLKSPPPCAVKKSKKTVKLFWKEVRDDPIILSRLDKNKMIWDELSPVPVDTQKLEHLFESRAKDLITKKQQEMNKNKEIIVLDHKRSNAINIGMTKLPPPRSIKTAILKMDATIMNREGIEKLLTMLPTEEERSRIQEAQAANPDLPLGSAEQFLLTLASISELPARLKLWAFKLDFENSEKEIADPLMDLKQGMENLRVNKTFRGILSTLLSIGIFLNGNEVKGFQLEYLAKVPEVKDTVHKHSLLHHLCHMVMEKFPDSTDLYSEIGAVTRASKIDFEELASNIGKLESECKASWDHLKLIAKHDGSTMMKVKMSDFLADCAERIIVLGIVHRRIINRFHKFILWLGIPLHRVQDTKPNEFCRIVSEFALEYRTTRERVIQQLEKKANHRERNKTRGKMITEVGKFRTKEDRADAELRQLLGSDISDVESLHGTLPWRRQRKDGRTSLGPLLRDESTNGNFTDGDDELLESLVKTATKTPATRTTPRERKRTRHADRKSLRRTLKNGLSEEEKKHIAAYIKGF